MDRREQHREHKEKEREQKKKDEEAQETRRLPVNSPTGTGILSVNVARRPESENSGDCVPFLSRDLVYRRACCLLSSRGGDDQLEQRRPRRFTLAPRCQSEPVAPGCCISTSSILA